MRSASRYHASYRRSSAALMVSGTTRRNRSTFSVGSARLPGFSAAADGLLLFDGLGARAPGMIRTTIPANHAARSSMSRIFLAGRFGRSDRALNRHGAARCQAYTGLSPRFNADGRVAKVVVLSVTRIGAGFIAGLEVAGRSERRGGRDGTIDAGHRPDRRVTTLGRRPRALLVLPPPPRRPRDRSPLSFLVAELIASRGFLVGTYKTNFNPIT